eukprot:gene39435-63117_t
MVRFTAVALQSLQSGYARIPASLDDSARMLGTTGFGLAARVHWPLLKRSTAAAALLVFVDVMKDLPATLVLRPFNSDTLAVVTYQLARDERLGEAALPALTLVLVAGPCDSGKRVLRRLVHWRACCSNAPMQPITERRQWLALAATTALVAGCSIRAPLPGQAPAGPAYRREAA